MATEPLVIRQPDKIPPVVTRSKEPEPFLSRITSEGDDQVTLWPRPTDDSESSDREGSPSTSNTNAESSDITPYLSRITSSGMEPPETVVTEESTITGDMITKTDSGSTVTVPNNEVVTITRHTTILTDRPPPLPSTTLLTSVTTPVDVPGSSSASATGGEPGENTKPANNGPGLTTGAFVGISVGGAVVIAILVLVIFTVKKRRRKQQDEQDATRNDDFGRDEAVEEKHFPDQMTPHTTGTQGDDPFAPFGGRGDRTPENVPRPPTNVFEMDATSAAPIELPAISPGANPRPRPETETENGVEQGISPINQMSPTDPRANLNSLGVDDGEPRYVNHWNQYRAMGQG